MTAKDKARALASVLTDKKGGEVCILDVRDVCSFTEYLVIATGTSERHAQTLAQEVERKAAMRGEQPVGVEGAEIGRWILIDLDDVVVHVFQEEAREHYALERLWGEAETVEFPRAVGSFV